MIHVACAADEAYIPHAAAMMHSLLQLHAGSETVLHLLHPPALPDRLLAALEAFVRGMGGEIRCHPVAAERVAGLPTMGRISQVMWYRLFLPELLADASRVLYLDCDTLVVDSVQELWRTDLAGAWVAAVSNVFEPGRETRARAVGLSDVRQYFNSGVLLIDLDAWRREDCAGRILALARDPAARLVWPDQDALNTVLAGRWHALHPRWNCQNSLFFFRHAAEVFGAAQVAEATRCPGILHFEGGALAKPWHYLCKHPLRERYRTHRAATPWPLLQTEGRTFGNRLLRPLPLSLLLPTLKFLHRAGAAVDRRIARILPSS
ncbi:MAG: glycosyltransferase family 8 protein [Gammaproteobacteria bacterium]